MAALAENDRIEQLENEPPGFAAECVVEDAAPAAHELVE